jgi:hypothetical protein
VLGNGTYQLYTSSRGGKIFLSESISLCRKRFSSRKSLCNTSSRRWASQLGSSVSISSFKSFLCSLDRPETHLSLSNLMGAGSVAVGDDEGADFVDKFAALGAPKKEVKFASFLGFFKSKDEAVSGSALRFTTDICLGEWNGI